MAAEVALENGAIVCGSLSPVMSYWEKKPLEVIKREYASQLQPFLDNDVDFVLAEVRGGDETTKIL